MRHSYNLISSLALIIFIIIIIWARNKGFDLTDEGFYLSSYSVPGKNIISTHSFHWIQNFLFPFVECNIQNLRIERLIISVLTSIFFSYCSIYYLKEKNIISRAKRGFSLYALVMGGVFLSYAFGPQTPSYNTFSMFFIVTASSLFLIDISRSHNKIFISLIYILIGIVCGMLFMVKFPNAIILPFIFILFCFVNTISAGSILSVVKNTMFRLCLIIVGYIIFNLIFWKDLNVSINFHKSFFKYVMQLEGYENDTLLNVYAYSLKAFCNSLLSLKFLLIILSLTGIVWCLIKNQYKLFYIFLSLQVFVIIIFKMYNGGEANKFEQTIIYFLWALSVIIISFVKNLLGKQNKVHLFSKHLLFNCFLLFMPLVGILGTNNLIQVQVVFYMPFWIFLIYYNIEREFKSRVTRPIYLLILLLALTQSVDAVINHPYRIKGNLFTQKHALPVGKNEIIYVDEGYKEKIGKIRDLLYQYSFSQNDYLFYYSDLMGLSYIFNHPMPGLGNYWFNPITENENCNKLRFLKDAKKRIRLFFILDNRFPFSVAFKKCLKEIGYDFDNYIKVGQEWVDFNNDPHYVSIYVPDN